MYFSTQQMRIFEAAAEKKDYTYGQDVNSPSIMIGMQQFKANFKKKTKEFCNSHSKSECDESWFPRGD